MTIVTDSSPLILLAKINQLHLLKTMHHEIHIPTEVHKEVVVRGKEEKYGDAYLIDKAINDFIFVKKLNDKWDKEAKKFNKILGSGESEAIALALQEKSELLLMDNLEPRKVAEINKLKCRSTPGILLEALRKNKINYEEYIESIKKLSSYAWLSGDIVAYFLEQGYKKR